MFNIKVGILKNTANIPKRFIEFLVFNNTLQTPSIVAIMLKIVFRYFEIYLGTKVEIGNGMKFVLKIVIPKLPQIYYVYNRLVFSDFREHDVNFPDIFS